MFIIILKAIHVKIPNILKVKNFKFYKIPGSYKLAVKFLFFEDYKIYRLEILWVSGIFKFL